MKTIFVGDLHLQGTLILPMVEDALRENKAEQVVLLGDYLDQWNQSSNVKLYGRQMEYLLYWKKEQEKNGIKVTCLIGNHDAPYLVEDYQHYSVTDNYTRLAMKKGLLDLGVQVAYTVGDYLITHAGLLMENELTPRYFEPYTDSREDRVNISILENTVGSSRGGWYMYGSCLWADLHQDLPTKFNSAYPNQIVGHTPVREIKNHTEYGSIFGADTFSLGRNWYSIGDGSLLMLEDAGLKVLETAWYTISTLKNYKAHGFII